MIRSRFVVSVVALGLSAVLWSPAPHAAAAFPGHNGRIAFETGRSDKFDIWSMTPGGMGRKRLTRSVAEEHAPAYSPGGTRIAFSRNWTSGGQSDIFTMASGGGGVVRLTKTPAIVETDPAWSPNSARIAFSSSKTGGGDIYTMRASDGTHKRRLTFSPKFDFQPVWSQTNRIAFSSDRTGGGDIYVMRADGTHLRRLTNNPDFDGQPAWSPDGTHVAFVRLIKGRNPEIFVIRANGTHLRRLTRNPATDQAPAFAPAGNRIAFMSDRGQKQFLDIYTMRTDGTGARRLTKDGFIDGYPDWQPVP